MKNLRLLAPFAALVGDAVHLVNPFLGVMHHFPKSWQRLEIRWSCWIFSPIREAGANGWMPLRSPMRKSSPLPGKTWSV